ncbi:helix-turn-helix domain containing protein [Cryobacterium sp. SO2]|uniref:TetR/AcrR family transcriptional regulator n=1 Tax=Cryobacterium sp. SO2 TaxID=1897060 RepID=UPI00223D976B|nr:TetR/AcrR family transcriptional regulator [Cryobacterium sp. SO2]WEO78415.1 helix-turn-helix domain containing protein [Cryobacterium sp. SO2]
MTSAPKASSSPNSQPPSPLPVGRRERGKQDKRGRILAAAADLFAEYGYSAVTTQDIADRADVAIGTLFRYATSKPELLTMVYNTELSAGIDAGITTVTAGTDPTDQIMRLLSPLVDSSLRQRENLAVYQREILFGDPDGAFRAQAVSLIVRLESAIADVLGQLAGPGPGARLRVDVDVSLAARSIFSALHMEIIRTGLGREAAASLPGTLRAQIELLMRGITLSPPGL